MIDGRVVRIDGPRYWVDTGDEEIPCTVRGRLKKGRKRQKQPVVVGDDVQVTPPTEGETEGVVETVGERRTKLSRRAAGSSRLEQTVVANVDQLVIVSAAADPPFRAGLVDRMLVAAAQGHLEPLIVVNKTDLAEGAAELTAIYAGLGYRVIHCSAETGEGLEALREALRDRSSVLSGHSGVGKSTLINALCPGMDLRTGAVSHASNRGRHTTTWVSLLRLDLGDGASGYVVDTPGIRSFSIWDLDPADLDIFFREFEPLIEQCRYPNCTHTHEPRCAVKDAVESGVVTQGRYDSYLAIRDSILEDLRGHRR